jgi:hypothetical protein
MPRRVTGHKNSQRHTARLPAGKLPDIERIYRRRRRRFKPGRGQGECQIVDERFGYPVKKDVKTTLGVMTPAAKLIWQHEFLDDDYLIGASFAGYPPPPSR